MSEFFFDPSELNGELNRLTADPKNNNFLANFVKMPQGSGAVQFRILPALPSKKWTQFYCATRTHKLLQRNVHCPRELIQGKFLGKCAVCDYYSWLYKQADKGAGDSEALKGEAKSIKAVERYYYNVIVRDNKETGQSEKNGPLILSIGKVLHTKIIVGICGDKTIGEDALGNVMDRLTGYDFKIIKSVKPGGQFPEYAASKFVAKPSVATHDENLWEEWLKARHDIFALRKVLDEEALKKELRIYKGAEPDPRQSFNPEEFMASPKKPVSVVTEVPKITNDIDDDMTLADDDFVQDLRADIE